MANVAMSNLGSFYSLKKNLGFCEFVNSRSFSYVEIEI